MRLMTLTIKQPWAELIISGMKPVENRKRRASHTGLLLIHAGKKFDKEWKDKFTSVSAQHEAHEYISKKTVSRLGAMDWHFGCVIGFVVMWGCDMSMNNRWCNYDGWYYRLALPYRFSRPIPVRGMQQLFYTRITPDKMATADWRKVLEVKKECIRCNLMEGETDADEETE